MNDAREFSLCLSPHIIANVLKVLAALDWEEEQAIAYVGLLVEIVHRSGGQMLEPRVRISDGADYEDNRILELALAAGAVLIVSDDSDLWEMSPWRGIPIVRPAEFAGRVDAMRRPARRRDR
jgi:predicted nucleic acid-binding protein